MISKLLSFLLLLTTASTNVDVSDGVPLIESKIKVQNNLPSPHQPNTDHALREMCPVTSMLNYNPWGDSSLEIKSIDSSDLEESYLNPYLEEMLPSGISEVEILPQGNDRCNAETLASNILLLLSELSLVGGIAYTCAKEKRRYSILNCKRKRHIKQVGNGGKVQPIDSYLANGGTLALPMRTDIGGRKKGRDARNQKPLTMMEGDDMISLPRFFQDRAYCLQNMVSIQGVCVGDELHRYLLGRTFNEKQDKEASEIIDSQAPVFASMNISFRAILATDNNRAVIREKNSRGFLSKAYMLGLQGLARSNMESNFQYKMPLAIFLNMVMAYAYDMQSDEWFDTFGRCLNVIKRKPKKWAIPLLLVFGGLEGGSFLLCFSSTIANSTSWLRFLPAAMLMLPYSSYVLFLYWTYIYYTNDIVTQPTVMKWAFILSTLSFISGFSMLYKDYPLNDSNNKIKECIDDVSYTTDRIEHYIQEGKEVIDVLRELGNDCILNKGIIKLVTEYLYSKQEQELFIKESQHAKRVQRRKATMWGVGSLTALIALLHNSILVTQLYTWCTRSL